MASRGDPNRDEQGSIDPQFIEKPGRTHEARPTMPEIGDERRNDPVVNRELRLAGVLSVAPDAIIAVGTDAKIRIFNSGAEKLFGHRAADIMGQPLEELIPSRFRAAHSAHIKRFRASPEQSRLMTERSEIIGLRVCYHGRSFMATSVTAH